MYLAEDKVKCSSGIIEPYVILPVSSTKIRYANIERKLLAVVFECLRFPHYLYEC